MKKYRVRLDGGLILYKTDDEDRAYEVAGRIKGAWVEVVEKK